MHKTVELIPVSEGNRIIVKLNEKIIIGRGSSLGCNDKKISRNHAELLLKDDETLWIKPVHTNPVFYRSINGKTVHLTKDIEQELKDGDQIGLLPTSFFFRITCSNDEKNNNNELSSSPDGDSNMKAKSTKTLSKDTSLIKKSSDVELKSSIKNADASNSDNKNDQDEFESMDSNKKPRKLPAWMLTTAKDSSSAATRTITTTKTSSSYEHDSLSNTCSLSKRSLSSEEVSNSNTNDLSNASDKVISESNKSSKLKSFDNDSADEFDSPSSKRSKSLDSCSLTAYNLNLVKSSGKRRPACSYGSSCYRKNPIHRTEEAHPGDSDYDDNDTDIDKPPCPYGKSCYRQNAQHKHDYRH